MERCCKYGDALKGRVLRRDRRHYQPRQVRRHDGGAIHNVLYKTTFRLDRDNALGLVAVHGVQGEARITIDDLLRAALSHPEVTADPWVLLDPDALAGIADRSRCQPLDILGTLHRHVAWYGELESEGIEFERFCDAWITHLNSCRCKR